MRLKNLQTIHLIGHSLGAHLCGYAGYHLQRDFGLKIERITALDRKLKWIRVKTELE